MYPTLTPAYGRDYKSKAEIQAHLAADKDFLLQPQCRPINRPQLLQMGATRVNIRYNKMRSVAVFTVPVPES